MKKGYSQRNDLSFYFTCLDDDFSPFQHQYYKLPKQVDTNLKCFRTKLSQIIYQVKKELSKFINWFIHTIQSFAHISILKPCTYIRPYVGTSPPQGLSQPLRSLSQPLGGLCQPLGGLSQPLGGLRQPLGGLSQPLGGLTQPLGIICLKTFKLYPEQ